MAGPKETAEQGMKELYKTVILRSRTLTLPQTGKFVVESHYVTGPEFSKTFLGKYPNSMTDHIQQHLETSYLFLQKNYPSFFAIPGNAGIETIYRQKWEKVWQPSDNYNVGGNARSIPPTLEQEIWHANMMFVYKTMPRPGVKYKLTNPATGRSCIVCMGYEQGPGDEKTYLGGASVEVHKYLGSSNEVNLVIDYVDDQSLPYGPVTKATPIEPTVPKPQPPPPASPNALMVKVYDIAYAEKGVSEVAGPKDNSRIVEYHKTTDLTKAYQHDEVPWCASFVGWCLEKAGLKSTNDASAISYENYGKKLEIPTKGCICVFSRDGGNHVAFFDHAVGNDIYVLGGNQSNMVCIKAYPKSRLLGYRGY